MKLQKEQSYSLLLDADEVLNVHTKACMHAAQHNRVARRHACMHGPLCISQQMSAAAGTALIGSISLSEPGTADNCCDMRSVWGLRGMPKPKRKRARGLSQNYNERGVP